MSPTVGPVTAKNPAGGVVNEPVRYPGDGKEEREPTIFEPEEIKAFAGDILRGELGFIELDEYGTPQGVAEVGILPRDKQVAPVQGAGPVTYDEVVTPSGAPLTKYMNPSGQLWDDGMLARNPIPEENQPHRDHKKVGDREVEHKPEHKAEAKK